MGEMNNNNNNVDKCPDYDDNEDTNKTAVFPSSPTVPSKRTHDPTTPLPPPRRVGTPSSSVKRGGQW